MRANVWKSTPVSNLLSNVVSGVPEGLATLYRNWFRGAAAGLSSAELVASPSQGGWPVVIGEGVVLGVQLPVQEQHASQQDQCQHGHQDGPRLPAQHGEGRSPGRFHHRLLLNVFFSTALPDAAGRPRSGAYQIR